MLSTLAPLYKELFPVCSNGGIPNLKFVAALMNVHKKGAVYHSLESVLNWAPVAVGKIRMMAAHYREIASDGDKMEICFRKALGLKIVWATSYDFRMF